jgi:hypothetical protein
MAIKNDQELRVAVAQASSLIQDIHEYCGRTLRDDAKINFPRGMIGTADSYRARMPGYLETNTISSCVYGFMHLDVVWWLVSRTDLASVGRQMALKSAIVSLGTILEATLQIPDVPKDRYLSAKSNAGVIPRVRAAVAQGWISADEGTALEELWTNRNNVHTKLLPNSELDLYKVEHINAPQTALLKLLSKLTALHDEGQLIAAVTAKPV